MDEYLVPTQEAHAEFTEKRSRFIGHLFPVPTEAAALAQLEAMRKQYWDATHNVYAYILHGGAMRYSDDAEPQGTAGMPVLEVLRREGLENVLCVVTRYFGGILLGAGGLVRAYTKSAHLAVEASGISQMRLWQTVLVPCPYPLLERVKQTVTQTGGQIFDAQYGADVALTAAFPKSDTPRFFAELTELSGGKLTASVLGEEYRAIPLPKEA
ncbi:MAG: YigZ family protein [Oscillospiraceae bacterium]|nr:YigZ family protein [Oscillospiraceae bacterium]